MSPKSTEHPILVSRNSSAKIEPSPSPTQSDDQAKLSNSVGQNHPVEVSIPAANLSNDSGSRPRLNSFNLRTKATIVATLLGVIPVLGVGSIAFSLADPVITQQVARNKEIETIQLADKLTRFMVERSANISTLATLSTPFLSDEQFSLAENERQVLADQFTSFVRDYLVFDSIILSDTNGRIITQSRGAVAEPNLQNQAFFQRVVNTRQIALSEPTSFQSDTQNPFAIYLGAPVLSSQGQLIGVISARLPVDFLGNNVLRSGGLNQDSTYRLVDTSGNIFQNFQDPNEISVGSPVVDALPLYQDIRELSTTRSWISEDESNLNAFTPMGPVAQLDWGVVTSTPTDIAFAAQNQLLIAISAGTLVTALLAALLGAYLAKAATRPVIEAANAVKQIGQGNLQARTRIGGQDELSVLGNNINRMADQIETFLQASQENTERLQQQTEVLANLAKQRALAQGDIKNVVTQITETVASILKFNRVATWLSVRGKFKCIDTYNPPILE